MLILIISRLDIFKSQIQIQQLKNYKKTYHFYLPFWRPKSVYFPLLSSIHPPFLCSYYFQECSYYSTLEINMSTANRSTFSPLFYICIKIINFNHTTNFNTKIHKTPTNLSNDTNKTHNSVCRTKKCHC